MDHLYKYNYYQLVEEIKKDLNRWKLIPIPLFGRTYIIRMNILPRSLFLFKALHLNIKSLTFRHWDRMLLKFIWVNKKPRVKMKTLKLAKRFGGLALPNLQTYYRAAYIQTIQTERQTKWKSIELASCKGNSMVPTNLKKVRTRPFSPL